MVFLSSKTLSFLTIAHSLFFSLKLANSLPPKQQQKKWKLWVFAPRHSRRCLGSQAWTWNHVRFYASMFALSRAIARFALREDLFLTAAAFVASSAVQVELVSCLLKGGPQSWSSSSDRCWARKAVKKLMIIKVHTAELNRRYARWNRSLSRSLLSARKRKGFLFFWAAADQKALSVVTAPCCGAADLVLDGSVLAHCLRF